MSIVTSLDLPDGYQHFDWDFDGSVRVCDPDGLRRDLRVGGAAMLQLYTQHEIFWQDGVIKHTRSSPNWDGGLATFATCKHLLRSYDHFWSGAWLAGLCPRDLSSNTLLFAGKISEVFDSNHDLGRRIIELSPEIFLAKSALTNPRGDLYTPNRAEPLTGDQRFDHGNFIPPTDHTRSVEMYKKSPGSLDGKSPVPKWWRDHEYVMHGRRPKVFILRPFYVFSRPMVWTSYEPGRATLRLSAEGFLASLREAS